MSKNNLYNFDLNLKKQYFKILGIDEVGRGCIAGPLVVCGVILNDDFFDKNIKDSKKIKSIEQRKNLKNLIIKNSLFCEYEIVEPEMIDIIGPKKASVFGMEKIAKQLINNYDLCLTDYEKIPNLLKPQMNLTKGDNTSFSIACASIVAKSVRDDLMEQLHNLYPHFECNKNQGYLTKKHIELLNKYGPIKKIHRFSYKPMKLMSSKI
ncbi:MAG: ribonuclease HII [Malacoplasma sp.]|nr:ribonuclease HII [Malacoplasma sp.]